MYVMAYSYTLYNTPPYVEHPEIHIGNPGPEQWSSRAVDEKENVRNTIHEHTKLYDTHLNTPYINMTNLNSH